MYPSLERERPGNPNGLRLADAHGTLRVGLSPARVCGQGPSDGLTSPSPLGKGGLVSLQASSGGETPGKRPRFGSGRPEPFAWDGPVSGAAPFGLGAAVASSSSSSDLSGPVPGSGSAHGLPVVSVGAPAANQDGLIGAGVRRSQRSWKPT